MKYKMIGFDLDGTLVNSLSAIAYGTNIALKNKNLKTYDVSEFKNFVGGGLDKLTEKIIKKEGYNIDINELANDIKQENLKSYLYELTLYNGIDKLLDYLVLKNIKIVVITNKPHNIALENEKTILSKWKFAEFIGARENMPTKPDKSLILEVLNKYNIKNEEFLYIGDMLVDIQTAQNSNVDIIYCNWGYGNLKGEIVDKSIKRVNNIEEIIEYIEKD